MSTISSNKSRNNLPVLKIKECPNGDAEFAGPDFMIKVPIKFSRILDNLDYSTLGNVGRRYNLDGSQGSVFVVIHYNPDKGHSVTVTDSNSDRQYGLEKEGEEVQAQSPLDTNATEENVPVLADKENFPEGTVRQVSEHMFVLSTNGPILNLYTDLYFSGDIVKEIHQHKGKDGTIIFRESLFRYPSGRTHEPYELTVNFKESGDHVGILTDRAKGSVLGRFWLALDLQEQLEKVEPSLKPINVTLGIAKKEDNMFGLPKIEDVRKKTDDALQISIAKIGSAINEASSLGERTVAVTREEYPSSSVDKIIEELEKAGYDITRSARGTLVIDW